MKTLLTGLFIFCSALLLSAQNQWTYDMYKTVNHKNFRTNSLFQQTYNASNPDIPLLHAALFFMTNEERVKNNVAVLDYHPALEIAAYNHSKKMAEQNFFSHTNTEDAKRSSTSQRGKLAGVANPSFAENIAYNYPPSGASYIGVAEKFMTQWMNSSGHRSNILSKSGLQAGCGVYPSGSKMYATQVFQWFNKVSSKAASDRLPPLKDGSKAKAEGVEYAALPDITPPDKDETQNDNNIHKSNTNSNKGSNTKSGNTANNTSLYGKKKRENTGYKRFLFVAGIGPSYHYGTAESKYSNHGFPMINAQGEALLGFNFRTKDYGAKHSLAAFLKYGITNSDITQVIINQQLWSAIPYNKEENFNYYRQIEGGLLIGRVWRLSGGAGSQYIEDSVGKIKLNYYTFTTGFLIHFGDIKWNIGITGAGANDYNKIQYTLYSGFNFGLDFIQF